MLSITKNVRNVFPSLSAALLLLVVFGLIANYLYSKYVIYENINDYIYHSDDQKEKDFSSIFPSRRDIEDYLYDTTILKSYRLYNEVQYFDKENNFFDWTANDKTIDRGKWFISPLIDVRMYNCRWSIDIVYCFSSRMDVYAGPESECSLIGDIKNIFEADSPKLEHIKGDLFNLSAIRKAPFGLPSSSTTLMEIKAKMEK